MKLALCAFLFIVMLFPFIWMVSTSFKFNWDVVAYPPRVLPQQFAGLESYKRVFDDIPFLRFFSNSMIVAVCVTAGSLFTSMLAGFVFAKYQFPGKNFAFIAILATMMIPFDVVVIPLYLLIRDLRLLNNLLALIIPGLVSSYGIFLCRQFISGIPDALIDAARIDGCPEFKIFYRLVVPLSIPVMSALAIFAFMANWDSFLWPLLVIDDITRRTLPLGLSLFRQQFGIAQWNVIMAGAVLSVMPVMVVYLFAQRNFIEGITLSGIKL